MDWAIPPVVVVLAAQHVDVQRHAGRHRKRVEDVREHLRREVPNLLALELQVRNAVWAPGYVDNCS